MPRYAIIDGATVENVIVANSTPSIPGRIVVALSATQAVGPGDGYSGGVFTSYVPSAAELERRDDGAQLRQAQATLRQWAIDAEAIGSAGGTPTAAQLRALFSRFGLLCRLLVRIIRRLGEDDGA